MTLAERARAVPTASRRTNPLESEDRMGEQVRLTARDGHTFDAYRADPGGKPVGGVVVIQEIFGLTAHMQSVVDRYAAEGFAAVAPALFDRVEPGRVLDY